MKNEYLFLAGAAGFSLLPSILRRSVSPTGIYPTGAPISSINLPQGKVLRVDFTIKNTGSVTNTFGVGFDLKDPSGYNYGRYLEGGVTLEPDKEGQVSLRSSNIGNTAQLGVWNVSVYVNEKVDLMGKNLDISTGTVNVVSGLGAQITLVTVTVV